MLDLLLKYLSDVEGAIRDLQDVYIERYEEEFIAKNRMNLRIRTTNTTKKNVVDVEKPSILFVIEEARHLALSNTLG